MKTFTNKYSSFSDILIQNSQEFGKLDAYTFLADGEQDEINITYEELHFEAQKIAGYLQQFFKPGDRALLFFHPGLDFIKAFYGCLYAKIIAIPSYPPRNNRLYERIDAIMKNADACIILTNLSAHSFETFPRHLYSIININEIEAFYSDAWKLYDFNENDIAFLQYTSGSTGMPKGVIISHKNIISNQKLIQKAFNQTQKSIIVGWLPFYHDMGLVGNILHPAYLGARSILISPQHFLQKPERWLKAITKYSGTTSGGPNFAYTLCIDKVPKDTMVDLDLSSWEVAFTGAEPIRAHTLKQFSTTFKECGFNEKSFQPCYGMAEATLFVSAEKYGSGARYKWFQRKDLMFNSINLDSDNLSRIELVSCGFPSKGDLIVVNSDNKVLNDGAVGEIWIKGDGVTQGYWGNNQLTRSSFSASPLEQESLFFKTGDLGLLYDGALYITGRVKDLIIINGQNYYPEDIETALLRVEKIINSCAAFSIEENNKEKLVIIAEVNTKDDIGHIDIITKLNKCLFEEFRLSPLFVGLVKKGNIFKTSSGKIQRSACKDAYIKKQFVFLAKDKKNSVDVSEKSNIILIGQKIVTILEEVFECKVDVDNDIFSLGIDSIKAAQISIMLSEEFNKELSLELIFEHHTIRSLAEVIDKTDTSPNTRLTLESHDGIHSFDTTPMQKSIWFHQHIKPDMNSYNIPLCLKIGKGVDIKAFSNALNHLVEKYEILRTVFIYNGTSPQQAICQHSHFELNVNDYNSDSEKNNYLSRLSMQPFKLDSYPLWRAEMIKNNNDDFCFLFVIHHIISDGHSLVTIQKELLNLYYQYQSKNEVVILYPKFQFKDYSEGIKNKFYDTHEEYWKKQLSGELSRLQLPETKMFKNGSSSDSRQIIISSDVMDILHRISNENNASIYMILLSAFVILLNKVTNQSDIIVGAPVADRDSFGINDMPGIFLNIIMLRVNIERNDTFITLINKIKKVVLDALKYKSYPFEKVLELTNVVPGTEKFAISSVFFNGLNFTEELSLDYDVFPSNLGLDINFDINCYVIKLEKGLKFRLDYKQCLFDSVTIENILSKYSQILELITQDVNTQISQIKTKTDSIPTLRIEDAYWYRPHASICDIINDQFKRFRRNIAIKTDSIEITYEQLNIITNKWANHIIEHSNSDTSSVCFLVSHDQNHAISVISILKAGKAYVALDSEYPHERLKMIINEVSPSIVLTDDKNINQVKELLEKETFIINIDEYDVVYGNINNVNNFIEGASPAYVLYTSGSTGKPKGILQTHENVLHFISNYTSAINITEKDKLTGFSSCCYDSFNNDLYGALLNGATYCPLSIKENFNDEVLATWIETNNITVWHSVPTLFSFYSQQWIKLKKHFPSLRIVKMTGQTVSSSHFELFKQIVKPHALFVVSLGSTESTLHCINTYGFEEEPPSLVLPVGYPVNRTRVLIVDESFIELDVLEVGEIIVESDHVALGYINQPELTCSTFISKNDKLYYVSGDVGRKLPNGKVQWLYRSDSVIKKNGIRIDIAEIEHYLMRHPKISDAVVVDKKYNDSNELICYMASNETISIDDVESFLRRYIPYTSLPSIFIKLDGMPRTPNGKVDRRKLLDMNIIPETVCEYRATISNTEMKIIALWEEILKITVNRTSVKFFQIGGNSMKAMQLITELNKEFNVDVPFNIIFERPTVQALAEYIDVIEWHRNDINTGQEFDEFIL